jgi:hypothetical protein
MDPIVMSIPKRRKQVQKKSAGAPIMIIPKQSSPEIARRVAIREALHDLRAKIVRGKTS